MNILKSIPKDKLQKTILVAIVNVAAVSAAGVFYVGSGLTSLDNSRKEIAQLQGDLMRVDKDAAHEAVNSKMRNEMTTFIEAQELRMVGGDPFSWVVRELSLLAEKHPVRVLSLRPGATPVRDSKQTYGEYTTHLEIEASYDQLGAFVQDLENSFPTGEIRTLEVAGGDPTRAERRVALDFALLVKPDVTAAKTPASGSKKSGEDAKL